MKSEPKSCFCTKCGSPTLEWDVNGLGQCIRCAKEKSDQALRDLELDGIFGRVKLKKERELTDAERQFFYDADTRIIEAFLQQEDTRVICSTTLPHRAPAYDATHEGEPPEHEVFMPHAVSDKCWSCHATPVVIDSRYGYCELCHNKLRGGKIEVHHTLPRTALLDPNGIDQHAPGAKLDAGKLRMGLVLGGFANALQAVSKIGTDGARKYTDNGWREVPNAEARYTDALLRHLFAHLGGEKTDPDSGSPHLAHVAWNILAVLQLSTAQGDSNK